MRPKMLATGGACQGRCENATTTDLRRFVESERAAHVKDSAKTPPRRRRLSRPAAFAVILPSGYGYAGGNAEVGVIPITALGP